MKVFPLRKYTIGNGPGAAPPTAETKVEKIPADIGEAQGLLWAFDSLYVMVNGKKHPSGLYRVRSSKGDDTLNSSITGQSTTLVNAASVSHFAVVAGPTAITPNSVVTVTVTAEDSFNNSVPGYSGTVHFSSSDTQATLPANSTLTNGAGTFSATLRTAGNQTITATDTVTGTITGTSNTIAVRLKVIAVQIQGTSA